jgi:hypothetical protein
VPQGGIFSDPAESGSRPIRSLTALRTMALGFAILCLVMLIAMGVASLHGSHKLNRKSVRDATETIS